MEILVVCTGNICRSPMAEALLRRHLHSRGIDAVVHSAGTMPWQRPPTDEAIAVMAERGFQATAHRSRPVTPELLHGADLVLGMTRTHVAVAATQGGDGVSTRAFLLGEVDRLGRRIGPRAAGEPLAHWVARLHAARDPRHGRAADEVPDPVGRPIAVYRATADRLDSCLAVLALLLAGDRPDRAPGTLG